MAEGIKSVLITGATSGIGLATARALASHGLDLVLPVRNVERGAALAEVLRDLGAPSVETIECDLGVMQSVRSAAAQVRQARAGLDVLVNDASVFLAKREVTPEGHERMYATNVLGPFLLTSLLEDLLTAAAPSRVINVTAPSTVAPDPDDLDSTSAFSPARAFGRTKAAELMFTYALARRLHDRGVTVNAYHPGVTRTGLMRDAPFAMKVVNAVFSLTARTPARAAEGLVDLALSSRFQDTTGELIHDGEPIRAPFRDDLDAQERLWVANERAAGLLGRLGGEQ